MRFPKETERLGIAALLLNKIESDPDDFWLFEIYSVFC
jgi:hypothetical protein